MLKRIRVILRRFIPARKWEIADKDDGRVELEAQVEVEASSDQESQSEATKFFLIFCILKDETGVLPELTRDMIFVVCELFFETEKKSKKSQKTVWDGWNKIMQKMSPQRLLNF